MLRNAPFRNAVGPVRFKSHSNATMFHAISHRAGRCSARAEVRSSATRWSSASTRRAPKHVPFPLYRESWNHPVVRRPTAARSGLPASLTRQGLSAASPHTAPSAGEIIAFPEVGGLHHRYERRAEW